MIYRKKSKKLIIKVPEMYLDDIKRSLYYHPPDFNYHLDYFLYVADKIIHISSYKKFKNLHKIPISSVVLRLELGKDYRKYLDYLLKYNFIATDNHYIVGDSENEGKCKCYCLTTTYKKDELAEYEISKKSLLKKYLRWKEEKYGKMVNDKFMGNLYKMMKRFTVDMDAVHTYLSEGLKNKTLTKLQAQLELDKCMKINAKDPYSLFMTKDSYGRVHTNFTNLSKHIRDNFIYMDGEKLSQLDVISSQPAFLYVLFKDYTGKIISEMEKNLNGSKFSISPYTIKKTGVDMRDKYVNKLNHYSGKGIYSNDFHPTLTNFHYTDYLDMLTDSVQEMEKYRNILKSGIYEFFQDKWEELYLEPVSRKVIKKEWITHVFGVNHTKKTWKLQKIWDREFPLFTKILHHFKNGSHKPLAHELQRREAKMIYGDLCPVIDSMGITYFTVHDCMVVKESEKERVQVEFEKVLKQNKIVTGVSHG